MNAQARDPSELPVATSELELSTEELLELSTPGHPEAPAHLISRTSQKPAPQKSITRRVPMARIALSICFIAVALMGAGALYSRSMSPSPQQVIAAPAVPLATPPVQAQAEPPAQVPTSEIKPVRFANPFDKNEVFEFPAGTSKAEARDAVAKILMERAQERWPQIDSRKRKKAPK